MCAIFGAIRFNGFYNELNWNEFLNSTDLVTYRGPDSSGYYCTNYFNKENTKSNFNLFLGHRRLSIIDLSTQGEQPMTSGDLVIVFNGEIFNYIELRSELLKHGCNFKTNTDTEVILKIYEIFGEKGFEKMNGMWAFAIYDYLNKKIVLSRDRFSKKPLFYYYDNKNFYFSSEIKQLLPLINNLNPNKKILVHYLKQGLVDYNIETFFDSIYRLEPKTNLTIYLQTGIQKKFKYWDYNITSFYNNPEEEFRFLLDDSIKIRMRSDVPLGCMLSGGLDSSSVSVIAQNYKSDIDTFSVISNDNEMSEEPFIDILIKSHGLKNTKMVFDSSHVIRNFDTVLYHQDEPFFNFSVLAGYSILKKIKEETNITVLLNGQGGDELLMGYLKYFFFLEKDLINKGKYQKAFSLFISALYNRTIFNNFTFGKAKRYLPFFLKKNNSYINESEFNLLDTWSFNSLRDRQISDIDNFSIPALCRYEDRNSSANSLEMRVPFLDYRLVSFCLNLSNDFKIHNGWTKYILRKVMNELPTSISYRRDKKGFSVPEDTFLRNDLRDEIFSFEKKSILDEMGFIHSKKFINYYKKYLNKNQHFTEFTDISRVYIAEKWLRKYFIKN